MTRRKARVKVRGKELAKKWLTLLITTHLEARIEHSRWTLKVKYTLLSPFLFALLTNISNMKKMRRPGMRHLKLKHSMKTFLRMKMLMMIN